MLIITKSILLLLALALILILLLCFSKLRKLVAWRFSNAYTEDDMAYFYEIITSEEDLKDPIGFMKKHKTYQLYKSLSVIIFVISMSLFLLSVGFDMSMRNAMKPSEKKIEYCQSIITKLYTTHPNDFQSLWENDLIKLIDKDISYKLNPNNIENLSGRHRILSSEKTIVEYKGWYANEDNEILLWYKITSPTVIETRQMQFLLDENNKIIEMHEFKEPEFAIKYILGDS